MTKERSPDVSPMKYIDNEQTVKPDNIPTMGYILLAIKALKIIKYEIIISNTFNDGKYDCFIKFHTSKLINRYIKYKLTIFSNIVDTI